MPRPMLRRHHLPRYNTLGSALIATLVVMALIAFAVAAMLYNVRQLNVSTNDKIGYEESYHVAMAGLQMGKSWVMEPARARNDLPQADAEKMNGITSGSVQLAFYVKANRDNESLLNGMNAAAVANYYTSQTSFATSDLYGGRKLIWEYDGPSDNGKAIVFQNDAVDETPDGSMFSATDNVRGYVSKIRFTTPFREDGTFNGEPYQKDDLRRVSMIIEAEGIVEGKGMQKKRILRQKVLAVPGIVTSSGSIAPPLSPGSAIVSGGSVMVQGSSHMDVFWGPVQVKGNADLLDIDGVVPNNTAKTVTVDLANQPDKWHHSGFDVPGDSPNVGVDKWLKWQVSGLLYSKSGSSRTEIIPRFNTATQLFETTQYSSSQGLGTNQKYIADLYTQLLATPYTPSGISDPSTVYTQALPRAYGNAPGWDISSARFPAGYASATITTTTGANTYFRPEDTGLGHRIGEGAFVQKSTYVANAVDSFMNNDMNYTTWKQFAQAKNLYAKPGTGGYVNDMNVPLYVNPFDKTLVPIPNGQPVPAGYNRFTELKQITMKSLVPANGDTLNADIPDRILFIDTAQGTPNGTPTNISLGANDDFFWKGLLYIQGNLTVAGSGNSPTVKMMNPDQFAVWQAAKELNPDSKPTNTGFDIPRCICDGILYASGVVDRTGNSTVYGTVASKGGMGSGGGPVIYYNSRNKFGLFQAAVPKQPTDLAALISGPLYEVTAQ